MYVSNPPTGVEVVVDDEHSNAVSATLSVGWEPPDDTQGLPIELYTVWAVGERVFAEASATTASSSGVVLAAAHAVSQRTVRRPAGMGEPPTNAILPVKVRQLPVVVVVRAHTAAGDSLWSRASDPVGWRRLQR